MRTLGAVRRLKRKLRMAREKIYMMESGRRVAKVVMAESENKDFTLRLQNAHIEGADDPDFKKWALGA